MENNLPFGEPIPKTQYSKHRLRTLIVYLNELKRNEVYTKKKIIFCTVLKFFCLTVCLRYLY